MTVLPFVYAFTVSNKLPTKYLVSSAKTLQIKPNIENFPNNVYSGIKCFVWHCRCLIILSSWTMGLPVSPMFQVFSSP